MMYRMMNIRCCILMCALTIYNAYGILTRREARFVLRLVERLSVLQCIFITDTATGAPSILVTKLFSGHRILSSFIDSDSLFSGDFPGNHLKTLYVLKMSEINVEDIFYRATDDKRVVTRSLWLILPKSYGDIVTLPIPYDCELYAAIDYGSNITIHEIYTVGNDTIVREVGSWAPEHGLSFSTKDYLGRRLNLQGLPLKRVPFGAVIPGQMDLIYAQSEVVDGIQSVMNISFEVVPISEISEKGFDVIEHPVVYSALVPSGNVIAPTIDIVVNMYVKKAMLSLENYYIKPFEPLVWISILAWIVAASLCLMLVYILINHGRRPILSDLLEILMTPLDAFCLQDGSSNSRLGLVRWIKMLSRAVSGIIFPAYSASIISYMTVRMPFIPFDDLKGLAENGNYKLGGQRNTFQLFYFNLSGDKVVKTVKEKFLLAPDEHPEDLATGIAMMCSNDHFVFMGYSAIISNMDAPCQILQIRKPITKSLVGFELNRDSPFGPAFRKLLLRFYSAGIINKRQKRLDSKATPDDDLLHSEDIPAVSLSLVYDIFGLLLIGIALSLVFLCTENLFEKRKYFFTCKTHTGRKGSKPKRPLFFHKMRV